MTIELIKIQDTQVSPIYFILVDGQMIPNGLSGNLDEVTDLYNRIVADPGYLIERKVVLQSTTI